MQIKTLLTITGLGIFFLMLTVGLRPHQAKSVIDEVPDEYAAADWYADGVIAAVTDATGQVVQRYQADKLLHFDAAGYTEMYQPRIEIKSAGRSPWQLQAGRGRSFSEENHINKINFWEAVHLEQIQAKDAIRIDTKSMTVFPDSQVAQSDAAVSIKANESEIAGEDFLFNMMDETLEINQAVRSHYARS